MQITGMIKSLFKIKKKQKQTICTLLNIMQQNKDKK